MGRRRLRELDRISALGTTSFDARYEEQITTDLRIGPKKAFAENGPLGVTDAKGTQADFEPA